MIVPAAERPQLPGPYRRRDSQAFTRAKHAPVHNRVLSNKEHEGIPFGTSRDQSRQLAPRPRVHPGHIANYGEHDVFANPVGTRRRTSARHEFLDAKGHDLVHLARGISMRDRQERELRRLHDQLHRSRQQTPEQRLRQKVADQLLDSATNAHTLFGSYDRKMNDTVNYSDFQRGLQLAGVEISPQQRKQIFDENSQRGKLNYPRFIQQLHEWKSPETTSLPIEDIVSDMQTSRDQNRRLRLRQVGHQRQRSNSTFGTNNTGDRLLRQDRKWHHLSSVEQKQALVRDKVMRKLHAEQDNLEGTFVDVDQQRDGALNRREFHDGLTKAGILVSEKDASTIFEDLPRGEDGLLDYHKFAKQLHHRAAMSHNAGHHRSTNYTKADSTAHIVQKRVSDAVAQREKELELVFKSMDDDGSGIITLPRLNDALKRCGVILSVGDTQRLFDRVDVAGSGSVPYRKFLQYTCGMPTHIIPESIETQRRRVRGLRAWGALDDSTSDEQLLQGAAEHRTADGVPTAAPAPAHLPTPAGMMSAKERDDLVVQQRIVNAFIDRREQLAEVFGSAGNEVSFEQLQRGARIAGVNVSDADARRFFDTVDVEKRGAVSTARVLKNLEHMSSRLQDQKPIYRSHESLQMAEHDHLFSAIDRVPLHQVKGSTKIRGIRFVSEPPTKDTAAWCLGDTAMRQERLASEKILRRISAACDADHNKLDDAFKHVMAPGTRDAFINIDEFQAGLSNLGIQLGSQDCRQIFSHFHADEQDTLNYHAFAAMIRDRTRADQIEGQSGLRLQSEGLMDHRILLDSHGVPTHTHLAPDDNVQSLNIAHWTRRSEALMHGRINSDTIGKDVAERLRRIAPREPQSCYYYLQRVAQRFDTNKDGRLSHGECRRVLYNMDATLTDTQLNATVKLLDPSMEGSVSVKQFIEKVMRKDKVDSQELSTSVHAHAAGSKKQQARFTWAQHKWQKFQNNWIERHGAAARREMKHEADIGTSGATWSRAPGNKQPFRVLRLSRAPLK